MRQTGINNPGYRHPRFGRFLPTDLAWRGPFYPVPRTVLAEYDRGNERETAMINQVPPEELMRRIDEFLISIGPVPAPCSIS
jgi:hypothetical protein